MIELLDGIQEDGYSFGENFFTELGGAAVGAGGSVLGGYLGGGVGTLICPGLGTVIGATVGTVIFSWLGEETGEYIVKDYYIRRNEIND